MGMTMDVIDRANSAHRLGGPGPTRGGNQRPSRPEGLDMSHPLVTPAVEAGCSWEASIEAVTSARTVKEGIVILSGRVATCVG
jgi:hypothetical protein